MPMEIKSKQVKIREIIGDDINGAYGDGFKDNGYKGVSGMHGKLDIRPPYQRDFRYNATQQQAVIQTVLKGYPLNVMYWSVRDDDTYEVLDGQQRTISIARFRNHKFSIRMGKGDMRDWNGLSEEERESILNYPLFIYFCKGGTDKEKLDWFETINIAGTPLKTQEIRNAVHHGPWVAAAKEYFSRSESSLIQRSKGLVSGNYQDQTVLETALTWLCYAQLSKGFVDDKGKEPSKSNVIDAIGEYMGRHRYDENADELKHHFLAVIEWVKYVFGDGDPEKEMRTQDWGRLYFDHKERTLDIVAIRARVEELYLDDEVTKQSGIYPYVLDNNESHLQLRQFTNAVKKRKHKEQNGKCVGKTCPNKDKVLNIEEMEADHIIPWSKNGKTLEQNCQLLCKICNATKGAK